MSSLERRRDTSGTVLDDSSHDLQPRSGRSNRPEQASARKAVDDDGGATAAITGKKQGHRWPMARCGWRLATVVGAAELGGGCPGRPVGGERTESNVK